MKTEIYKDEGYKLMGAAFEVYNEQGYGMAEEIYQDFFASLRKCVVIEQSHQGQLHRIIRMSVAVPDEYISLAKSGSNPISPLEVYEKIHEMALALQRQLGVGLNPDFG